MKIQVQFIPSTDVTPIRKSFIHEDVMVLREENDRFVLLLQSGQKLTYAKKYYSVNVTVPPEIISIM